MIGVVLFTFFQNASGDAANSLAANLGMATKVYFPRLILPLAAVASKLIDLLVMLAMLGVTLLLAGATPTFSALVAVPVALLIIMVTALGTGLWLSALSIQYRDVRFAQTYFLQLLMYVSPVIYSAADVPAPWRWAYQLNPLAGAIEAARASLLSAADVPWRGLGVGALVALALCASGVWYFRRSVRVLADVA
jgi:lipopolysaccharide transport system permease protein